MAFTKKQAFTELEKGYKKAETLLKDDAKVEGLLGKLDRRVKWVPFVRDEIKSLPILISMLRSYWKKEYTKIPYKSMVAIVSALLYFLSPLDVVPDWLPFLGQLDDAVVISVCWKLVNKDIEAYRKWKAEKIK